MVYHGLTMVYHGLPWLFFW